MNESIIILLSYNAIENTLIHIYYTLAFCLRFIFIFSFIIIFLNLLNLIFFFFNNLVKRLKIILRFFGDLENLALIFFTNFLKLLNCLFLYFFNCLINIPVILLCFHGIVYIYYANFFTETMRNLKDLRLKIFANKPLTSTRNLIYIFYILNFFYI